MFKDCKVCGVPCGLSEDYCRWVRDVYNPAWLAFCEEVRAGRAVLEGGFRSPEYPAKKAQE